MKYGEILQVIAIALVASCAPLSFAGGAATTLIKQGFTAEMTGYHWQHPQEVRVSRIFFSANGMRLQKPDMFGRNKQGWTIHNFKNDRSWVVQPRLKIYAVLPETKELNQQKEKPSAGLMSTEVCASAQQVDEELAAGKKIIVDNKRIVNKKVVGTQVISGFKTVIWECVYPWYSVKQFFSAELAMVIREEYPSQHVAELRNIEKGNFGDDYFQPPADWYEVSLEEFFLGAKPLESYSE